MKKGNHQRQMEGQGVASVVKPDLTVGFENEVSLLELKRHVSM